MDPITQINRLFACENQIPPNEKSLSNKHGKKTISSVLENPIKYIGSSNLSGNITVISINKITGYVLVYNRNTLTYSSHHPYELRIKYFVKENIDNLESQNYSMHIIKDHESRSIISDFSISISDVLYLTDCKILKMLKLASESNYYNLKYGSVVRVVGLTQYGAIVREVTYNEILFPEPLLYNNNEAFFVPIEKLHYCYKILCELNINLISDIENEISKRYWVKPGYVVDFVDCPDVIIKKIKWELSCSHLFFIGCDGKIYSPNNVVEVKSYGNVISKYDEIDSLKIGSFIKDISYSNKIIYMITDYTTNGFIVKSYNQSNKRFFESFEIPADAMVFFKKIHYNK